MRVDWMAFQIIAIFWLGNEKYFFLVTINREQFRNDFISSKSINNFQVRCSDYDQVHIIEWCHNERRRVIQVNLPHFNNGRVQIDLFNHVSSSIEHLNAEVFTQIINFRIVSILIVFHFWVPTTSWHKNESIFGRKDQMRTSNWTLNLESVNESLMADWRAPNLVIFIYACNKVNFVTAWKCQNRPRLKRHAPY